MSLENVGDAAHLFELGRLKMRNAFVELSDAARRLGIDEDFIQHVHGEFFDGNVEVKDAVRELTELVIGKVALSGGQPVLNTGPG